MRFCHYKICNVFVSSDELETIVSDVLEAGLLFNSATSFYQIRRVDLELVRSEMIERILSRLNQNTSLVNFLTEV